MCKNHPRLAQMDTAKVNNILYPRLRLIKNEMRLLYHIHWWSKGVYHKYILFPLE